MFSFKKQISKIPEHFFEFNESKLEIYSINYTLQFEEKKSNIAFFNSIAFYILLDNNENRINVSFEIIQSNEETQEYISLKNNDKNLKNITSIVTSQNDPEIIKYKKTKIIQSNLDYSVSTVQEILDYMEKEVYYAEDETRMFLEKNNITTEDSNYMLKILFVKLKDFFKKNFSVEKIKESQYNFNMAEIIHNQIIMNNTIPVKDNLKKNIHKF